MSESRLDKQLHERKRNWLYTSTEDTIRKRFQATYYQLIGIHDPGRPRRRFNV
jgi:hypothetical protein